MATIRISDELADRITNTAGLLNTSHFDNNAGRFYFMQGTIPTQSELNAATLNFRSGDRLAETGPINSDIGRVDVADGWNIILSYSEMTGIANGTATWWLWDCDPLWNSTTGTTRIAGTISATGGGGDLEMSTTTIVIGQTYAVGPVTIPVPTTYTY